MSGWLAVGDTLKPNGNELRERIESGIPNGASSASQGFPRFRIALQSLLHLSCLQSTT